MRRVFLKDSALIHDLTKRALLNPERICGFDIKKTALLENCWRISQYVADDAIAKLYVT